MNKDALSLLSIPLQQSCSINCALYGNFSGPKQHELVVSKGNALELLRIDEQGNTNVVCSAPGFCIIRSLATFRIAGSNRDYVVIGSDAGKISVVEFDTAANSWRVVHCEVFGRTGCRRAVAGQYLAADPKGRAIMIAAIEKQKFVYIMNRDSSNKLTISSPLEAHKSETIVFSCVGLDVEFENPIFALIELEYTESDQDPTGQAAQEVEKNLVYYEVDLGLNNVVRKWSEPISRTANFLLAVPGGAQLPGGVLVCGENWVSYKHQGHRELRVPLPRRLSLPTQRGTLITAGTMHKMKETFFFLLQSEYGDLYKVSLELDAQNPKLVRDMVVQVFDALPVSSALCITKNGLLFAASEFGNHSVLQFQSLDAEDAVTAKSVQDEELGDDAVSACQVAPCFVPSPQLQNLLIVEETPSLSPLLDLGVVQDFHDKQAKQMYALCGRGERSSLRVLRHGVTVSEFAESPLPGKATNIWTVKKSREDEFDAYIVVSFLASSLVLSIGDTVQEETESGFLTSVATLQVGLLASNVIVQVHSQGVRMIRSETQNVREWKPAGRRVIQFAAVNSHQAVVALAGGEIIYFELDEAGALNEVAMKDLGREITCLDLGEVESGRVRSSFLAIGFADDQVQLLSLDPRSLLEVSASFPTGAQPTAVSLVLMSKDQAVLLDEKTQTAQSSSSTSLSLFLNIGTSNGMLQRLAVDAISGALSDPRRNVLGATAVRLKRVRVLAQCNALMALTSRAWLTYHYLSRYQQTPLSYERLECVADISVAMNPQGMVAVVGHSLRFISIENLGELFNQTAIPLKYTPRKFALLREDKSVAERDREALVVVIESDANEFCESERLAVEREEQRVARERGIALPADKKKNATMDAEDGEGEGDELGTVVALRRAVPPAEGKWASAVRVLEARSGATKCLLELGSDEAALSLCVSTFEGYGEEEMLVVGVVTGLTQTASRAFRQCTLHVYRLLDRTQLQLLHKTEVEDIPLALTSFQGKLLVGIGKKLRLYGFGKQKLLKKLENKTFPNTIVKIQVSGDRIFVGDVSQSVSVVKYRENSFTVFADDTMPRFITCMATLDHNTVVCGDKFGNVFVLRLPASVNDDLLVSNTSSSATSQINLWEQGYLNGAPNKLEILSQYYLGEIPTAMVSTKMKLDTITVLIVATITGGIYALLPNKSSSEATFFQQLEMFMRQEYTNLCQRDHLAFRSVYGPVKSVIDISLCEKYMSMSSAKQHEFAESVDRTPSEIIKKLEEIRNFI